jgi:very-short-patch-repair endonuclease
VPLTNTRVAGWEVDAYWPQHNLVVEVDGFAYHGNRAAFERDRRKDAALTAAGLRVVRITWRRLVHEGHELVALLARLLPP